MKGKFGRLEENNAGSDSPGTIYKPYTELADIYDRVMDHVNYVSWAKYISSVIVRFGLQGKDILEIACGTGSLSTELYKLGYSVTCSDVSHTMIARAAVKFKRYHIPLKLFISDMRTVPLRHQFDVVLCIYDSVNYLTSPSEFIGALVEVAYVTRDGGLFIFDVCTMKNSELFFSDHSMVEYFGDIRCQRICKFDRTKCIQENHFIITKQGKNYTESHYQRIYRLKEISAIIEETPWQERGIYDDLSFLPGNEDSERVHFVLQKDSR